MFKGSMVALVTPMNIDQSVDYSGLAKLVDFHLSHQTDALVVVGTTGEAAVLSAGEKFKIIEAVVKQVAGKIPVIAGTAAQGTQQTIELTQQAESLGVDGALVMTPAYIKPPQRSLIAHYRAVAQNTKLPIILYNVPGRTACDLSIETAIALADVDNIIAIKEASGDVLRTQAIIENCGDKLMVYSGEDALTLDLMKLGAKGAISVTANIAPRLMHKLCQAALDADWPEAQEIDNRLQPLHEILFCESNPIACKWALSEMGYCTDVLRMPLLPLDEQFHHGVRQILATID
jgi:4-hydroxy-tetrahydrodipicolinate synthase